MSNVYLLIIGLLLLVPVAYGSPAYSQTNALETQIIVDEPVHDGLYWQNDRINATINFVNHSDQPIHIGYSFNIQNTGTEKDVATYPNGTVTIQPHSNQPYSIPRAYSAGNYRIYASAYMMNSTSDQDDSKEFFIPVATPLELYTKQALNYTLYGVIISAIIAVVAIVTAIWTRRQNERQRRDNNTNNELQRKDTRDYVDKQLKLMQESNQQLQESNELTRESLKLKQSEYKASLGKPDLEIVNTSLEYSGSSTVMRLYPNFRNDGKTHARNVRIYYHVFDKVIGLEELVKLESEIKQASPIEVPGSVAPTKSIQLHTANAKNKSIEMRRKDRPKPTSLAVWYTYEYLDDEHDEVIFNIQYTDTSPDNNPIRYTSTEVAAMREKLKGKT